MKISVYTLNNTMSLSIVQFEEGENIFDVVRSMDADGLRKLLEERLGRDIKYFAFARGALVYDNQKIEAIYMRIHFDDGSMHIVELYKDSAMLLSNIDALQTLREVQDIFKAIQPSIRIRERISIAF